MIRLGPANVSIEEVAIKIFEEVITSALESIAKRLSELKAVNSGDGRRSLSAAVLARFALGSRDPSVFTVAFHFPFVSWPWPFR